MPVVTVQNEALQFEVEADSNLLQALRKNGVSPYGIVSQYMPFLFRGADDVLVIEGRRNLSDPTEKEQRVLGVKIDENFRLASETVVKGDVEIHTAARIKI
jgi:ferredoxin